METEWQNAIISHSEAMKPVCGILSVALPAISLPVDFVVHALVPEPSGPHHLPVPWAYALMFGLFCCGTGFMLGITGIARKERYRWLSVCGLIWSVVAWPLYLWAVY